MFPTQAVWWLIKRHNSSYGWNEPENEWSTFFPPPLGVPREAQLFLWMKWTREWTVSLLPLVFIKWRNSSYGWNEPESAQPTPSPWCSSSDTALPTDEMNQWTRERTANPLPLVFIKRHSSSYRWNEPMNRRAHSQPPTPTPHLLTLSLSKSAYCW